MGPRGHWEPHSLTVLAVRLPAQHTKHCTTPGMRALNPAPLTWKLFTQKISVANNTEQKKHLDIWISEWPHPEFTGWCQTVLQKEQKTNRQTQTKNLAWSKPNPSQQEQLCSHLCSTEIHRTREAPHGWALLPSGAGRALPAFTQHTHSSPCSLPGYFSQKSLNPAQVLDVKCRITSPELNHWLL